MLCYKERYPLLLDCFIPSLICIEMAERNSGIAYMSPLGMVHNMSFLPITNIKCHANLRFDHPLSIENMMLCCKYRYLLLMKCFIISLGCITIEEKASDSIYEPLMVHNVSFLSTTNLKFHAKFQVSGTLSAMGLWCWWWWPTAGHLNRLIDGGNPFHDDYARAAGDYWCQLSLWCIASGWVVVTIKMLKHKYVGISIWNLK